MEPFLLTLGWSIPGIRFTLFIFGSNYNAKILLLVIRITCIDQYYLAMLYELSENKSTFPYPWFLLSLVSSSRRPICIGYITW